ncbi:MAG: hypothetical protein Q4A55_06160 [Aerococcus sp.]|nr:hypothetical protein [Aerococcus sp.]
MKVFEQEALITLSIPKELYKKLFEKSQFLGIPISYIILFCVGKDLDMIDFC